MNRRGFALVELMVVMTIIGILANIAIPIVHSVKVKAQAAQVIGDINVIRTAAYDHYAEHQSFPRNGSWGSAPREMSTSLPSGFSFERDRTAYRWIRLNNRQARNTGYTAAIRARIRDAELLKAVKGSYRGDWIIGNGNQLIVFLD